MSDAFDHVANGAGGATTDPLHHDPLGAMGTGDAQQPAAVDGQSGADGVHTLAPGAAHEDFLGDRGRDRASHRRCRDHDGGHSRDGPHCDADRRNESISARPTPEPAPADVHDMGFGVPDHDAAGNGVDAADPMHHDPGMFGDHQPGDPDAHHMAGMSDPTVPHTTRPTRSPTPTSPHRTSTTTR